MKFERQHADFDYNRMVVISDLRPQRDVDAQLALLAGNPTSETAIALAASYALAGTDSTQRLLSALHAEFADQTVLFVGDSTGNETTEWIYLLTQALAAQWPRWTVQYRLWNDGATSYDAPVTIQAGTGSRTLTIYNASVAGYSTYSWQAARADTAIYALDPVLTVISLGHNEGTQDTTWRSQYLGLTESITARLQNTSLLLIGQNPASDNTYQQQRNAIYLQIAARRGYGFIDVCQAFLDADPTLASLLADTKHPNATGSALWRDTVLPAFTRQARMAPRPQQPSTLLTSAKQLISNGNFASFTASVPDGWTADTITCTKDTTNVDSPVGWSVKIAETSSGGSLKRTLPLAACKGRTITVDVTMFIPAGSGTGVGRFGISHTGGTTAGSTIHTQMPGPTGGFRTFTVSRYIPTDATGVTLIIYPDTGHVGGQPSISEVSVHYGWEPRALNTADKGDTGATGSASVVQFDHLSTMGTMPALTLLAQTYGGIGVGGANQGILVPIKPPRDCTIAALEWYCQTPSGNYDIALLDASGTRLWSKGSTAMPSAGAVVETVSPTVALTAGTTYYAMMAFDNTTGRVRGVQGVAAGMLKAMNGSAFALLKSSVFPVPSSLTPGTAGNNAIPLVALREAA